MVLRQSYVGHWAAQAGVCRVNQTKTATTSAMMRTASKTTMRSTAPTEATNLVSLNPTQTVPAIPTNTGLRITNVGA
jgi:hypothetical protein